MSGGGCTMVTMTLAHPVQAFRRARSRVRSAIRHRLRPPITYGTVTFTGTGLTGPIEAIALANGLLEMRCTAVAKVDTVVPAEVHWSIDAPDGTRVHDAMTPMGFPLKLRCGDSFCPTLQLAITAEQQAAA